MKSLLIAVILPALVLCKAATAQVNGIAGPTPTIGATSPLGLGTTSSVAPTGIPLGSTELATPGTSPSLTATSTSLMPGSETMCSTLGTSPSSMLDSTASYDGGGMALGTAPAMAAASDSSMGTNSGVCGSSTTAPTSTSISTTPTAPGGVARTGIPMGSTEIGNLGVSPLLSVPAASALPTTGSVGSSTLP